MYKINFFTLNDIDNGEYLEEIEEQYELKLFSLDDVKLFLYSDFYEAVFDFLVSYLGGIVITDKNDEIIYKECFLTDTLFDVYTNERGKTIYKEKGNVENDSFNYVMVNKLDEVVDGTDKRAIRIDIGSGKI